MKNKSFQFSEKHALYSLISDSARGFFISLYLVVLFSLSSCEKEKNDKPPLNTGNGVYITSEGIFLGGNAKVSYYNIDDGLLTEDLFQPANSRPLGDILQSLYELNDKMFLVVNNSQKIEVVNKETFVSEAVISGFTSPRHFLPVSDSKAYVTDLFGNSISVVNLNTNTITGSISCTGWTEELISIDDKAYVTNMNSDKVYVVNTITDQMEDSITVSYASGSIKEDKNGKLWVLCSGQQQNNRFAGLHRINPATNQVEASFQFPNAGDSPWRLRMNGTMDTLYFLNNDIYRMAISDATLPAAAFIGKDNRNLYGLGIDPETSIIYVSDAIDYVQRGMVYRYSPDGTLLDSFSAGIIPGEFWFD